MMAGITNVNCELQGVSVPQPTSDCKPQATLKCSFFVLLFQTSLRQWSFVPHASIRVSVLTQTGLPIRFSLTAQQKGCAHFVRTRLHSMMPEQRHDKPANEPGENWRRIGAGEHVQSAIFDLPHSRGKAEAQHVAKAAHVVGRPPYRCNAPRSEGRFGGSAGRRGHEAPRSRSR